MKTVSAHLLVLAGAVFAVTLPLSLHAQLADSDAALYLSEGSTASGAGEVLSGPVPVTRSSISPEASPIALSLDVWGDLFTPEEQTTLRTGSAMLRAFHVMTHAESFSTAEREQRMDHGSATGAAASWALVFGGSDYAPSSAPAIWAQPGNSFSSALEQRGIFMAADWTERSRTRGAGSPLGDDGFLAAWAQRAIALLPGPRGSLGGQAAAAGGRLFVLSALSGDWPSFDRMSAADFGKFCELWGKRVLTASIATEMSRLATPRTAALTSHSGSLLVARNPVPVTLFHDNF